MVRAPADGSRIAVMLDVGPFELDQQAAPRQAEDPFVLSTTASDGMRAPIS
jgi:hypothetical protein